jgi:hypothetical protein
LNLEYPIDEVDEEDYNSSVNIDANNMDEKSFEVLKFKQLMQDTK